MEVVRAEGKRAERLKRAAKVSLRKVVHDTVSSLINTLIGLYCCVRKKTRITTCGAEERAGRARGAAVLRAVRHMAIGCHPAGLRRHRADLSTACVTLTPPSRRHGQLCMVR